MTFTTKHHITFSLVFILVVPGFANAARISAQWTHFNYHEQSSDLRLNTESGSLLGIHWHAEFAIASKWWLAFDGSFSRGEVGYDGTTQSGRPLTTRTRQQRATQSLSFGYGITHDHFTLKPFISTRYWYWDRDIQATTRSRQLNEIYNWWERGVGIDLSWKSQKPINMTVTTFQTFAGQVQVDLTAQQFGKPVLNLGASRGIRTEITWQPHTDRLFLVLFYEQWRQGASNRHAASNGNLIVIIQEPESQTVQQGLRLGWRF